MIPLSYFLIAWVILLAIFGMMTLLTLLQMLKHGLPSPMTYASTFLFLIVTAGVVVGSAMYFAGVDWSSSVELVPSGVTLFPE